MSGIGFGRASRSLLAGALLPIALALSACGSDDGVSTSVGVSYGYGGYYGPGWYGGYYDPYPPVVVVPPDRPDRPDRPYNGNRPTTLPSEVGGSSGMASTRPADVSRPTSRPSPRPTPRPMPRGGGRRR
jgi:hypothetical protein